MNRIIFFFSLWSLSLSVYGQTAEIRNSYHFATKSKADAESFYNLVKNINPSDKAEMVAYKGAAKALLARYEPLSKRKEKLKEGIQWVEDAVAKAPKNVEVRLIRLSIQENLPKFLKYDQNIEEDRKFIQESLPNIKDKGLVEMIKGYFSEYPQK